jgi:DNA-binding XRE family transcriptional regulator
MPNIASVLREEILRLARKETRSQTTATKKAAAQHGRDIAELKRRVAALQRQVNSLLKRASKGDPSTPSAKDANGSGKLRFVAKGLRSHRQRLGLSAGDFGTLVGASGQSVYAWETGKTAPRREQVAKIAAVRSMGKREAMKRLERAGQPAARAHRLRKAK